MPSSLVFATIQRLACLPQRRFHLDLVAQGACDRPNNRRAAVPSVARNAISSAATFTADRGTVGTGR
jgi:hypothetical protein